MRPTRQLLDALDVARAKGLIQGDYCKPAVELVTEKQFMAAVIQLAKRNGFRVYHTHDSRRSEAGFPDLVLVRRPSDCIWVELKMPGNNPTAAQLNWIEDLRAVGQKIFLWRPCDWEEIERVLR